MRKTLITILTAVCFFTVNYTNAQSCCKKPAGNDMQLFALNKEFKAAHEAPLPLVYAAEKGQMIKVPTQGGPDANAFFVPANGPSDKVLLIFHEWWGLNDYIKREAENWQKLLGGSVAIYAVDLYDGQVAATPDEAGKLANGLDQKRGEAIVNGILQKIGNNKKIATLGWCFGGGWSFTSTVLEGNEAAGCVMYYGFPEKDMNRIKALKTNVLYIRGSQDNFIKEPDVKELEKNVKSIGREFNLYSFDAPHAFANPSNPKYNAKYAAEAQDLSVQFLKKQLMIE